MTGGNVLFHFGVKGQRWGVRRSKKELNSSGDATRAKNAKGKQLDELSNHELQALITRMNLEKQHKQLNKSKTEVSLKFIRDRMNDVRTVNEILTLNQSPLGQAVKKGIG